ncbi:MAG TPA: SIMPL domain-containing protein [Acidobacteriaceae bacterium]|nr:SIMPL domain-containing protein [Acidobacteriaceae bacterium]
MRFLPNFSCSWTVVAVCGLFAGTVSAQQIQINKDNRTIAITATDMASAMADRATVHVGFVAYAPDAQAAYAKGSKTSNAIIGALTTKGVAKTDIQSDSQSVAETQQYELDKLTPAEQAQRRFQVRQSWTVQTKADDAASVLNTAVNAGANSSGQIEWTVADEKALEAKAAGNALARARAIASQMAQGLGIQLGALIYASNQAPEGPLPMMGLRRGMAGMAAEVKTAPAPLSISPNKVERSATVYAVFAIQ